MFITVINDCYSTNDIGRQGTRIAALFGSSPTFVGIDNDFTSDVTVTASGQLVDALDAAGDAEGYILVNVAPRGKTKTHPYYNGSPFAWFKYKNTTVITSVQGQPLSLIKKLGLADTLHLLDIPTILAEAKEKSLVDENLEQYITNTQFRSFDFVPRFAHWHSQGHEFTAKKIDFESVDALLHEQIWFIDVFGNIKTTLLESDIAAEFGDRVSTELGTFTYHERLKDLEVLVCTWAAQVSGRNDLWRLPCNRAMQLKL